MTRTLHPATFWFKPTKRLEILRTLHARNRGNRQLRVLGRAVGLLGLAACVALSSCQILNRSYAAQGAQGKIAWPKDGDLWIYDLATRKQTKITDLPGGAAVTGATWSPDGKRVIFA